jgi:ATP-dependent Lhr-like helicase
MGYKATDYVARALLRRYGAVFRRAIERESGLPPWRNLLYVYRRMEARGDVRGGRFVEGFSGEQFALPEAVGLLRETRRQQVDGELVSLSAADPLNMAGTITPGQRVPALAGNRILYRDGVPVAALVGGTTHLLQDLEESQRWEAEKSLRRRQMMSPARDGSSSWRPVESTSSRQS